MSLRPAYAGPNFIVTAYFIDTLLMLAYFPNRASSYLIQNFLLIIGDYNMALLHHPPMISNEQNSPGEYFILLFFFFNEEVGEIAFNISFCAKVFKVFVLLS